MSTTIAAAPGRRAYTVLVMLFLFQTLNFFDKLVFGLSAVPLMKELNITPREYGLIGSAFFLLYSLSGVLVGLFVTGRYRTKWVLVVLALIWTASQLPMLVTGSLLVVALCRLLLGIGEGPGLPSALHAAYDWFPKDRRSLPSAVVLQGISAGFLIGSPLLTYVITTYGWRMGFATCAALGLTWMIAWSFLGGEGPYAATPEDTATGPRLPPRVLWADPTVIGVMIMSFASYWVVGMSAIWLPPFLRLGLGYDAITTGWIVSAVFAFQSPLLLGGSYLSQRLLRRGVSSRVALSHATTAALAVAGLGLLGAVHTHGALQLVLIALAFAVPSLTTIFGPVMLGNLAPAAQRGRLIVVIYSGNASAALASTYLTGVLVDAGRTVPEGFGNGMTLAATVLLLGAAASLVLIHPERTAERFARRITLTAKA